MLFPQPVEAEFSVIRESRITENVATLPGIAFDQDSREETVYSEDTLKYIYKHGEAGGQCVEFIQRYFDTYYDFPTFRGTAIDIEPNSAIPEVGSIVILADSPQGHVAIVMKIEVDPNSPGEYLLTLLESNYDGTETISYGRVISTNDPKKIGYFNFK